MTPLKFVFGVADLQLNFAYLFLALAIFLPFIYFIYLSIRKGKNTEKFNFFFYLLLLPLLLSWLVSFFVPILQAKRVLFLLPLFSLLQAWLIVTYQKAHSHLSKIFLVSILIINLFSTFSYWQNPKLQRENWRSLNQEIRQKFNQDSTAVVFSFEQPFASWIFYDQDNYKTFSTGSYYFNRLENPNNLLKELTTYRYVLVFDYLRDLTDPDDLLLKTVKDLGFKEVGVLDYPNIGFIRVYSLNTTALK